jgi:hypothetical protein
LELTLPPNYCLHFTLKPFLRGAFSYDNSWCFFNLLFVEPPAVVRKTLSRRLIGLYQELERDYEEGFRIEEEGRFAE